MDNNFQSNYIAYLIRLWREDTDTWRGMLENPHTGERVHFAQVDDLLAHLKEKTNETTETDSF